MCIRDRKTGEGKTITIALAAYLNALYEKGVHIVTVNDYLATRDAEWMGKVYEALGMTTGVVIPNQSDEEKENLVNKYSYFTGLSKRFVEDFDMRVDAHSFRKELLRDEGFSVGRVDSRYKKPDYMAGGQYSDTDVGSEGFMTAYVSILHTWFAEIGVEMKMLYQSGDNAVYSNWKHPQKWKGNDFGYVNTVPDIARAQRYNKDFKVYVSCGLYDLATPCFTAENFMYDNTVDMSRVVFSEFEAGHMMYNHQPSFDRFLKEVREFIIND